MTGKSFHILNPRLSLIALLGWDCQKKWTITWALILELSSHIPYRWLKRKPQLRCYFPIHAEHHSDHPFLVTLAEVNPARLLAWSFRGFRMRIFAKLSCNGCTNTHCYAMMNQAPIVTTRLSLQRNPHSHIHPSHFSLKHKYHQQITPTSQQTFFWLANKEKERKHIPWTVSINQLTLTD